MIVENSGLGCRASGEMLCGRSAVVCGEDINTEPEINVSARFCDEGWDGDISV